MQAPAANHESLCTLTPELEEGPYYLNETLFRSNITEDQAGVALTLRVKVVNSACEPLIDAFVDIWTCNSTCFYSGFTREPPAGKLQSYAQLSQDLSLVTEASAVAKVSH